MVNKYLFAIITLLVAGCIFLFIALDKTKDELKAAKEYGKTLENEIKRRDENEKELSKRITELSKLYVGNSDWADSRIPTAIIDGLRKQCKACK